MAQITFRLDDAIENTLRTNAKSQNKSVSDYIKYLIDLGLRVEEASQKKDGGTDKIDDKILQELQIKSSIASIETLLLSRQLFILANPNQEEPTKVLEQLHCRSETLVNKLLGHD